VTHAAISLPGMKVHSLIVCLLTLAASECLAVNDSLYFLLQRSTYLENILMPCAWWANPASVAEIGGKTALIANVTPLGNVYTIASARYAAPMAGRFAWGVGILGAGINPNPHGSLQADNSGARYNSHFTFNNPSIQIGAGGVLAGGIAVGVLADAGTERLPDGSGGQMNFWTWGLGFGIMTPYFLNSLSFAFSTMSTGHYWIEPYWDHDGKTALRFKTSDSLVMGSLEYTFSMVSGTLWHIYNSSPAYYQVFKTSASIKMLSIAGALLGYSQDLGILSDNGAMLHLGVELRRSSVYPFFGGYEVGVGLTQLHRDLLVHRLWVGYCLR
jgi:hypothetical protein